MAQRSAAVRGVTLLLGALSLGLAPARAQVPSSLPSPSQAAQILQQAQTSPGLADQIRSQIAASGMTPDQIRARLSAAGYPTNLLDSYLGAQQPGTITPAPGATEMAAVQALGLPPAPVVTAPVAAGPQAPVTTAATNIFGLNIFRQQTSQFLPLLSGPVPPDYEIGPGDELVLILTGDVELSYDLPVSREGFIVIPQVGQVFVANLTMDQLRTVLFDRLRRVYSGIRKGPAATTHFDVSVANVRAIQVFVLGDVMQPGAFQISALGTVLTALYAAGGPSDRGSTRDIVVRRSGKVIDTLDLYDYVLHGDARKDIRLENGDIVFVPLHGVQVAVDGAVRRPAIYELTAAQTLPDVLRTAGGFAVDADLHRLVVYRTLPGADRGPGTAPRTAIPVPLVTPPDSVAAADSVFRGAIVPPVPLQWGDSVHVDPLPGPEASYFVAITGRVRNPGAFPWRPGMTLRDLMKLAGGPLYGADLRQAEVARMPEDRSKGQLATTMFVPLDSTYLMDRDSAGRYVGPPGPAYPASGTPEIALEPFDNVLVRRQPEFELQRVVDITGEVKYPGTYALKTKTDRLADLIARAGGLTAQAYPQGVRFFRSQANVGRINIDLPHALADTASDDDVILQPNDSIFIPEFKPSVQVTGAVNAPGAVLWKDGEGLDYYIRAAGGYSYTADEGRTIVRYANGEAQTPHHVLILFKSTPTPGPGSEIVVPTKDLSHPTDYVALVGAVAQILASTVAILVIATKL